MTPLATKVSSCVGCGTPIIGEFLRCPVCHDRHVKAHEAPVSPPGDTGAKPSAIWQLLFAGFVLAQVVVVAVVLLMFAGKGCQ